MVVFAVDISRRMMELRRTSLQCGRRTLLSQQCNSISGMARLTSRQGHLGRLGSERYRDLSDGSGVRIEEFPSLKHRMHNNRQLARYGHGGLLKPILSRSFRPHVRRVLSVELRVRITAAAS